MFTIPALVGLMGFLTVVSVYFWLIRKPNESIDSAPPSTNG